MPALSNRSLQSTSLPISQIRINLEITGIPGMNHCQALLEIFTLIYIRLKTLCLVCYNPEPQTASSESLPMMSKSDSKASEAHRTSEYLMNMPTDERF